MVTAAPTDPGGTEQVKWPLLHQEGCRCLVSFPLVQLGAAFSLRCMQTMLQCSLERALVSLQTQHGAGSLQQVPAPISPGTSLPVFSIVQRWEAAAVLPFLL